MIWFGFASLLISRRYLLLLLFFTTPLNAEDLTHTVKMGYVEFPPYFYTSEKGSPTGTLVDLMERVTQETGLSLLAYSYPAMRMATNIANGKLDLWVGLATLPQFKNTTLVGKDVICTIKFHAYYIDGKAPIQQKEHLNGQNIGIHRGYSYGGWIHHIKNPENGIFFMEVDDRDHAFQLLARGRVDYILDYKGPAEEQLSRKTYPAFRFNSIYQFDVRFVVSNRANNAEHLLYQLEQGYLRLLKRHSVDWSPCRE